MDDRMPAVTLRKTAPGTPSPDAKAIIAKAGRVFAAGHPMTTCFERALFFSWYCSIKDCKYCFMSTIANASREESRRSFESILAEAIICKRFGWEIGFLSGGIGVFGQEDLVRLLSLLHQVLQKKIWLNAGVMSVPTLEACRPHLEGVIGTVEVLDPVLHKEICPSKPLLSVEKMFENAQGMGIKTGMTIIVGLGERIEDTDLLIPFIARYGISKIHIYGLVPQEGTVFADTSPPAAEYQAEWIARVRIAYPDIDIQCGIWKDRAENVEYLLRAGADSVSKFPAIRAFNSASAQEIEAAAARAGRTFIGTLTQMGDIDIDLEVASLDLDDKSKGTVKKKCLQYLASMKRRSGSLAGVSDDYSKLHK